MMICILEFFEFFHRGARVLNCESSLEQIGLDQIEAGLWVRIYFLNYYWNISTIQEPLKAI